MLGGGRDSSSVGFRLTTETAGDMPDARRRRVCLPLSVTRPLTMAGPRRTIGEKPASQLPGLPIFGDENER